jgi:hypothetical protein
MSGSTGSIERDMLKRPSNKIITIAAAAMAITAFALPSVASAGSWGTIGTGHTLDSSSFTFTSHFFPAPPFFSAVTSSCTQTQFATDVTSAGVLTITSATFTGCTATGTGSACTATLTARGLPWRATGPTTTNVQIHDFNVTMRVETRPGASPPPCAIQDMTATLTGTLTGGTWNASAHQFAFSNADGLTTHVPGLGPWPTTTSGTFRDTSQTLTLT